MDFDYETQPAALNLESQTVVEFDERLKIPDGI